MKAAAPRARAARCCRGCCAADGAAGGCRSRIPATTAAASDTRLRGFHLHGTEATCQTLGGGRLEKAVAAAFLEAVTPAGVAASTGAIAELTEQHDGRLAGQRLALERAEFESQRAERQFDACEPENRLVARTLERKLEDALAGVAREQRTLAALEHARPAPLSPAERDALTRLARDLPKLWAAKTTIDRDRKELLRALISEVVITVKRPEDIAEVEIFWEGGARTQLSVPLIRRGTKRTCTSENTIELIRRLAVHHPDHQIAAILNRQGRRTGTGLPFTATRVQGIRQRAGIPVAPHPSRTAKPSRRTGGRHPAGVDRDDPPLAARMAAAWRASHGGRTMADPAD